MRYQAHRTKLRHRSLKRKETFGGSKKSSFGAEKPIGVFAGQYYDQETGLHYNYHRYYDPKLGRYLRADPIGLEGGINLFVYSENMPTVAIDPEGLHFLIDPFGGFEPHTHSYPAPCRSCNVNKNPRPVRPGMLDGNSPDHYEIPKCTYCSDEFAQCVSVVAASNPTAPEDCFICYKSTIRGKPNINSCTKCASAVAGVATCLNDHCSEGRKDLDGNCKPKCSFEH